MIMTRKNTHALLSLCLLAMPIFTFGHKDNQKITAQFSFNQIDSLTNATVTCIVADTTSFLVVNTMWYVGSYDEGNARFAAHQNHFDIYILYSKNHKFYVQKIDNYSFFKKRKIKGEKVERFLVNAFDKMKKEKLARKIDTSYDEHGQMRTSVTIVDHKLVRQVEIIKANDTLRYEYPSEFSENKKNLTTYKFHFFTCLDKIVNQIDKKKGKRKDIIIEN